MNKYMKQEGRHIIAVVFLVTALAFTTKAQQTNFSGTWKLNTSKSEFGNTPSMAAVQSYVVEQNAKDISLKWTTLGNNGGEVTSSQKVPLDGSSVSAYLQQPQRTRISTIQFSKDGKTILFNKSYSKPDEPSEIDYTLTEKWALQNDGKELVIDLKSPAYTIKAVYDKQ